MSGISGRGLREINADVKNQRRSIEMSRKKTRMEINKMTRIKRKERKIQINIYLSKFNAPRDVIHDFT